MKTIIIILSLLIPFSSFSQDYIKTLKSNNRWNILLGDCTIGSNCYFVTYSLTLGADSIVSDTIYKRLISTRYAEGEDTTDTIIGLIREDTIEKKVYFRKPENKERLLYDYTVEINDTTRIYEEGMYEKGVVTSTDSVTINGSLRKRICVDFGFHVNDTIIEGIGSITYGLVDVSYIEEYHGSNHNHGLICFWESDTLIYTDYFQGNTNCYFSLITSIKDRNKNNSNLIIPNPARKIITVKSPKLIEYFSLYDISGKKIKEDNPYAKHLEIPVHELKTGYYILQINDKIQKIMIE